MATTKLKLAEQAQRILAGGNPSPGFRPSLQELALAAPQIMAKLVWKSYHEHKQDDQTGINGQFISAFEDVSVTLDSKKQLYYTILPASPIKLPHDMGVYMVSLMEDQTNPFIPLPNGMLGMTRNLASGELQGRQGYFVEGNRIYFVGMHKTDGVEKVLIKMVLTGSNLDDDDEFEVAPELIADIVSELVRMYSPQVQIPNDTVNDHQNKA